MILYDTLYIDFPYISVIYLLYDDYQLWWNSEKSNSLQHAISEEACLSLSRDFLL